MTPERKKLHLVQKSARQALSTKAKLLDKVIQLIAKASKDKDLAKIQTEYDRYQQILAKEAESARLAKEKADLEFRK